MDTFFIINDEMKIWRKNKGRLILQHYINKYKLFFFFFKKNVLMTVLKILIIKANREKVYCSSCTF